MGAQSLARDLENCAILGTVPTTTSQLELNLPVKFDQPITQAFPSLASVTNGLTALAGGAQPTTSALASSTNRITTVATAGDSVALPAAVAGTIRTVVNAAANACTVYALGASDVIQGIAAATGMLLAGGSSVEFRCVVAGTWSVIANGLLDSSWSTGTTTTTFAAGQLTGGGNVVYTSTATTPGSIATRTATQMFNDTANAQVGQTYVLTVINLSGSANTMTITGGSGVTLTGTATVAQNIARVYQVTFTSPTALVMQEMYSFTAAA